MKWLSHIRPGLLLLVLFKKKIKDKNILITRMMLWFKSVFDLKFLISNFSWKQNFVNLVGCFNIADFIATVVLLHSQGKTRSANMTVQLQLYTTELS